MEKVVIIINGSGGVGKDTLCDFAGKHFKVQTVSSITPIKEIAKKDFGWDGKKDNKSRKLLAKLKEISVEYNDLPFRYLCKTYNRFLKSRAQVLFVHIREGKEIDKFKKHVIGSCYTLLITRKSNKSIQWGNASDDNVAEYDYDMIYENDKILEEAERDFCDFLLHNTEGKLYKQTIFSRLRNSEKELGIAKKENPISQERVKMTQ